MYIVDLSTVRPSRKEIESVTYNDEESTNISKSNKTSDIETKNVEEEKNTPSTFK